MRRIPVHCGRADHHARVDWLEKALAEVDTELALTCDDAESPFLCRELVEFRDYLADELHEALEHDLDQDLSSIVRFR